MKKEKDEKDVKCYNHPKEAALVVCKIYGKGVCNNCLMTIAGNSYCKTCVEAGRVKVPTVDVFFATFQSFRWELCSRTATTARVFHCVRVKGIFKSVVGK
jgi:hypothetical protein